MQNVKISGRIVWGHPGKAQIKKDQTTKQPVLRDGKPVEQWAFGLAISKADFQNILWPAMWAEMLTVYPSGTYPPKFSWKYKDGDGIDDKGRPYSAREGYAGCMVLTISTEAFSPPVYRMGQGGYVQMTAEELKTGDYAAVDINLKANIPKEQTRTPGLYVNPVSLLFLGYGQEIINVGNPMDSWGATPQFAMPPGASAVPVAPAAAAGFAPPTMPAPGQPVQMPAHLSNPYPGNVGASPMGAPQQAHGQMAPGYATNAYPSNPAAPGAPAMAPPTHPNPHHGFVNPGAPGVPPGAPPMPGMMPPR